MRGRHSTVASIIVSGLFVVGVATSAAKAAPMASPIFADSAVEQAAWTQRCWWAEGPWGPRQKCRPVWVEPQYHDHGYGYGYGWDSNGGWGHRRGFYGGDDGWSHRRGFYGGGDGWERQRHHWREENE